MPTKSVFEFFEIIAEELTNEPSRIITSSDLTARGRFSSLIDDLKAETGVTTTTDAISRAVTLLQDHFEFKGAKLPFNYDHASGRFTSTDAEYLEFVNKMASIRSVGKRSRDFECSVAARLKLRATGIIHRVGWPRDTKKKKKDFISHLSKLGFSKKVALGKEKDGGLDILWMLPIGTIPHRPLLSVQCKNGEFDLNQAYISIGAGVRTLGEHQGLLSHIHVPCVLFNDYVYPKMVSEKKMNFVPLGLSDLATIDPRISLELI